MNDENLIPLSERSTDERAAIAAAGGRASVEARRRKKLFRDLLEAALTSRAKDKKGNPVLNPDTGDPMSRKEEAMLRLAATAAKGDVKAIELAARLLGEYVERSQLNLSGEVSVVQRSSDEAATWLYNDFSQTYQRFFYENRNSRHVLLQGGRRSGKTQATFRHLLKLTAAMGGGVKVLVVCFQHPQLLKTIEDFTLCSGVVPHADRADIGGVEWQFANFDDYTKAQGSQCDFLFLNEAVNLPEDIGDVLVLGTRLQVFYNFNPTKKSWVMKHVDGDKANLLCTTFKDNAYLPAAQVDEFEQMKARALRPNATMHDRYMYQVYYLGDFATMVGAVFTNIAIIDDYDEVSAAEFVGMDFGFATDGDPTTVVGVKIFEQKIYVKQYVYCQGLTTDAAIIAKLRAAGLNEHTPIFADYGGQGRGRIEQLIRRGWSVRNCHKTEVIDGLSQLLMYDEICIQRDGVETRAEFEGLELDKNQRPKGADHAIDAVRYAFQEAKKRL